MRRLFAFVFVCLSVNAFAQGPYLFVGTYTRGKSKGIYVYRFHTATGRADPASTAAAINPSYLAISKSGNFCYAVEESGGGGVSAYAFDRASGKLRFLNHQGTQGADPCYVTTDSAGKWLFTANYSGGSLSAFRIAPDGSVGALAQLIQHQGKGLIPERQEKAHVHSAIFSPDEKYLLVADLGLDREYVYQYTATGAPEPLAPAPDSFAAVTPAADHVILFFIPRSRSCT